MNKLRNRKAATLFFVLTLMCMIAIFMFSCQVAETSDSLSRGVSEEVLAVTTDYENLPAPEQETILFSFNEVIRSLAHFSIFLVMGAFAYGMFYAAGNRKAGASSFVLCAVYAVTDEIHQEFFSDGRAFQFVDLIKDWTGSLTGILISIMVLMLWKKVKAK